MNNINDLQNYLLSLSSDDGNRFIGWVSSEMAARPDLEKVVAEFQTYREAEDTRRSADFPCLSMGGVPKYNA